MANILIFSQETRGFLFAPGAARTPVRVKRHLEAEALSETFARKGVSHDFSLCNSYEDFAGGRAYHEESGPADLILINGDMVDSWKILEGFYRRERPHRRYEKTPILLCSCAEEFVPENLRKNVKQIRIDIKTVSNGRIASRVLTKDSVRRLAENVLYFLSLKTDARAAERKPISPGQALPANIDGFTGQNGLFQCGEPPRGGAWLARAVLQKVRDNISEPLF